MGKALLRAHLDGPIPGSSLTKEPRSQPWERPPQFVTVDDAMEHIMKTMLTTRKAVRLLALLDNGFPVEAMTRLITFGGFTQGRWTPDLAILLFKPVFAFILAMAKRAGIEARLRIRGDTDMLDPKTLKAFSTKLPSPVTPKEAAKVVDEAKTDVSMPKTGLMGSVRV